MHEICYLAINGAIHITFPILLFIIAILIDNMQDKNICNHGLTTLSYWLVVLSTALIVISIYGFVILLVQFKCCKQILKIREAYTIFLSCHILSFVFHFVWIFACLVIATKKKICIYTDYYTVLFLSVEFVSLFGTILNISCGLNIYKKICDQRLIIDNVV